jgi:tetratricopeptide (TPR) repeat protein
MLALVEADSVPEGRRRKAEALKELGYYHRNVGKWDEADVWYERARDHIRDVAPEHGSYEDLEELASICTNWAYVSALRGRYDQAKELVHTAVDIRRRLGAPDALALSLSVRGEILRYERSFGQAWDSYEEAAATVAPPLAAKWLGLLHQEQAICLFQAEQAGVAIVPDQQAEAERRALSALDICRDHFVRYYPSALNRAGRIFADRDSERALAYLGDAAEEARRLADTWFHVSSLIEYVELGFRLWRRTADIGYLTAITRRIGEVDLLLEGKNYGFPGLRGRSDLIRAHIAFVDGREHNDDDLLNRALDHYGSGLTEIARADVGADGPGSIAHEFGTFRTFYLQLDPATRNRWRDELRRRWSVPRRRRFTGGLLALLDDLT